MVTPENDLQISIRMPTSLKQEIDSVAEVTGITSMEFIRRAVREKLSREKKAQDNSLALSEEDFKRLLIHAIQTDAEVQAELRALKQ